MELGIFVNCIREGAEHPLGTVSGENEKRRAPFRIGLPVVLVKREKARGEGDDHVNPMQPTKSSSLGPFPNTILQASPFKVAMPERQI